MSLRNPPYFFFLSATLALDFFLGPPRSVGAKTFCVFFFQNRFDAFDKRKNNRGFEHENSFQEVNQQNSSTRFFFFFFFGSFFGIPLASPGGVLVEMCGVGRNEKRKEK
jgi:hypothetical protein